MRLASREEGITDMAWVNAPNTYWIGIGMTTVDSITLNSIYFERIGADVDRTHAHLVATTINTWAKVHIMSNLSSEMKLSTASATDMTTETSFTEFVSNIGGFAGSQGPMLPAVCGKRVYFKTGIEGRSFRGYNTIAGVPKSIQSVNSVSSLFSGALVDAYALLIDLAADLDCAWVVCSRHTGGADRAVALNTPITLVEVQHDLVDFWEQRKPGAHT
jgi:hypothetical protein